MKQSFTKTGSWNKYNIKLIIYPQKQYSDPFAPAAEDDTTVVGRCGGSGRGRKQVVNKKDSNTHSSSSKKNSEIVKTIYSFDENSCDVCKIS